MLLLRPASLSLQSRGPAARTRQASSVDRLCNQRGRDWRPRQPYDDASCSGPRAQAAPSRNEQAQPGPQPRHPDRGCTAERPTPAHRYRPAAHAAVFTFSPRCYWHLMPSLTPATGSGLRSGQMSRSPAQHPRFPPHPAKPPSERTYQKGQARRRRLVAAGSARFGRDKLAATVGTYASQTTIDPIFFR